jgi:transcription-repair coupling factor (superfamily II helicase)
LVNLVRIMRVRLTMKEIRIQRLDYDKQNLVVSFDPQTQVSPVALIRWAQNDSRVRLLPGDRLMLRIGNLDANSRIDQCVDLLGILGRATDQSVSETKAFDSSSVAIGGAGSWSLKKG